MARKSRRSQAALADATLPVQAVKIKKNDILLRTAAYGRLSVENGGDETDDTLQTQMTMLYQYIDSHPDLELEDSYSDNGYSGTSFAGVR